MGHEDLFSHYLDYASSTEVPMFFHRWSMIAGLGAYLGRDYYFSHGHFTVNPNIYCMLIGSPGTRKSTAIKLVKSILTKAGYQTIAADKTTKEKFLLDLAGDDGANLDDILESDIFGGPSDKVCECLIGADEFNEFIGHGNTEFISLLGSLWDYEGVYKNRIKTGKSISINNPTISILGGNTPTGFAQAFPTEIIGQGFFSRLLLIYGEPNGRKITFPKSPDTSATAELIKYLHAIKSNCVGGATLEPLAESLLDKIYKSWGGVDDVRFESYSNRRFTHLLKLCLIHSAARLGRSISEADVIYANTVLSHTEHLMPKALGEFGKAKNSDVSHKILQCLDGVVAPVPMKDLWKQVQQDLDKMRDLGDILQKLVAAEKIQAVNGGFLPFKKLKLEVTDGTVDFSLLHLEERELG
jgi:hypothetical protein